MKENLTAQVLKTLGVSHDGKKPLNAAASHRLFVYLQAIRYLFAMYGDKNLALSELTCPESFTTYLRAVMKMSNNAYAWSKDDIEFLNSTAFNPMPLDDVLATFSQLKENLKAEPYFVLSLRTVGCRQAHIRPSGGV